ncbi:tetratricopeptide repeat protein [Azospirillum soli]|uniref:tetratricopeptide repeat protein n=1 Tax=Azospirillum soli TaxID=1304799 RepID=UPI001AE6DDCB|nr:Flp pilus assembly protein TadD [Azospirillum soli]
MAGVTVALALTGCAGLTRSADQAGAIQLRQTTPERVEGLIAQGEEELRNGLHQNALSTFSTAMKAEPDNRRARLGMAEAHLAMGNADLALKGFEALPADMRNDPQVLQGRGIALAQQGKAGAAEQVLAAAVAADPSLWRSWNALGRVSDAQRNWDRAEASYRRALEINPSAAEVYNNLGYSLLLRGRYAEAIGQFDQALRHAPGLTAAQDNMSLANALMGQYDRALAAVPAERTPTALNNAGFAAITRGEYGTAESYLIKAVQDSSRHFGTANENLRWLTYLRKNETVAR